MLWPLSWDDGNWQSMTHTWGGVIILLPLLWDEDNLWGMIHIFWMYNHALSVVMRRWQLAGHVFKDIWFIFRKTIEGYLDIFPSLTFKTTRTKLIMHAFHSSRYLQPKWMFDFNHASMIKVQCMSKWYNPPYWKVTNIQKLFKSIFIVCIP